jgi:putative heme transporter
MCPSDQPNPVPPPGPPASGPPAWLDTGAQYAWRWLVILAAVAAALVVVLQLYLVVLPVIVALILATICVPPARWLERRGLNRLGATSVVVIGGVLGLAAVIAAITPAFVRQTRELGPTIGEGIDALLDWVENGPIGWERAEVEETVGGLFADGFATRAPALITTIGELLAALALTVVLLFFFVKDSDSLTGWLVARIPTTQRQTVAAMASRGWTALSGFVRGTAVVALIDAVGIGIGLAVIGVPLVLPLMLLVFLGGFIPVVGATVTGLLAVLVALAWGGLGPALAVLGVVIVVQQLESNVLQPVIMRRAVSLHPVVILSALTAGAVLAGIIGAFLAVPITAVLAAVSNELRLRREAEVAGMALTDEPIGGPGRLPATLSELAARPPAGPDPG